MEIQVIHHLDESAASRTWNFAKLFDHMIEARSDLVFQILRSMQDKLISRPDEECQICCEKLIKTTPLGWKNIYVFHRANTETNNTE